MKNSSSFGFGEDFSLYIKNMIPGSKVVSGGKEIVCRCKYCNDSSSIDHGHMYIKIPQSDSDVSLFHCFKCNVSGVLDSNTLMEWGIYDPNIGTNLDKINKKSSKTNNGVNYSLEWYSFNNGILDENLADIKLRYINSRLGTSLSISDCIRDKIILNLEDALKINYIQRYTRNQNIVHQLNQYFVGFLSLDNNFVNLRRICDEGIVYQGIDKRYINYNIHNKQNNTEKMYIIPSILDLSLPMKVQIHIAEGPFDILSIKYNLRGNSPNTVFAAVTGSGYKGLLLHIINTFKIFYFDLHIYPDNDKHGDGNMVNEIVSICRLYGATVYEHRNIKENEKDFGVSLDRIDEKVYTYY